MKGILYPAFFHLGNVKSEGGTSYYSGSDVNNAGSKIYKVPLCHGRLQIVFFVKHCMVLMIGMGNVVEYNLIVKRMCDHISLNFGLEHYVKYRMSGYPQGPAVLFLE